MTQTVEEALAALSEAAEQVEDFLLKNIIAEATATLRSTVGRKFVIRSLGSFPDFDYHYWRESGGGLGAFTGNARLATKFGTREEAEAAVIDRSLRKYGPEIVEA